MPRSRKELTKTSRYFLILNNGNGGWAVFTFPAQPLTKLARACPSLASARTVFPVFRQPWHSLNNGDSRPSVIIAGMTQSPHLRVFRRLPYLEFYEGIIMRV